ncbi:MAG: hypothetical protein KDD55_11265, partial [Bdellovibrionales bacterium]|nr:hypothetical protein [Bdellovibrionales bacterium]
VVFHARFIVGHRESRESQILREFGPLSTAQERRGKVVVATQVIEQSLDVDFDFMVSDLAPIDLIVQRAGRLRRHPRTEEGDPISSPDRRSGPETLFVYGPKWQEEPSENWFEECFSKAAYVYPAHGKLWLGAQFLRKEKQIIVPEKSREMIEYVYGDDSEDRVPQGLQSKEEAAYGEDLSQGNAAYLSALPLLESRLTGDAYYCSSTLQWEADREFATRLTHNQHRLRLVNWRKGKFVPLGQEEGEPLQWELGEISISHLGFKGSDPRRLTDEQQEAFIETTELPQNRYSTVLYAIPQVDDSWLIPVEMKTGFETWRYSLRMGLQNQGGRDE